MGQGKIKAKFDFDYPTHLFDDNQKDTKHLTKFKKGDLLPEELINRLRLFNVEHLDFSEYHDGVKDDEPIVKSNVQPEKKKRGKNR